MDIKKRRRRSVKRKVTEWTGLLLVAAASFCVAYITNSLLNVTDPLVRHAVSIVAAQQDTPVQVVQAVHQERKIYPYSVIKGGVSSREELAANIRTDRVVAEHFSGFNLLKARMVTAPETRFMYVSYRLKNKIYWTSKKIRIPQGEMLITDGKCTARGRCGNQVSATPMTPITEMEPDVESFDIPQLAKVELPQLQALIDTGLPPLLPVAVQGLPAITGQSPPTLGWNPRPPIGPGGWIPGPSGGGGGGGGGGAMVPEPGSIVLVLTGLAAVGIIGIRRRKKS